MKMQQMTSCSGKRMSGVGICISKCSVFNIHQTTLPGMKSVFQMGFFSYQFHVDLVIRNVMLLGCEGKKN